MSRLARIALLILAPVLAPLWFLKFVLGTFLGALVSASIWAWGGDGAEFMEGPVYVFSFWPFAHRGDTLT